MHRFSLLLSILLPFALALHAQATTIRVPADASTIQAGLNMAAHGDSVVVSCGTYFEHDVQMKSGAVLRSFNGDPSCVTIDATRTSRVVRFDLCDSMTRVEGITIFNGSDNQGAGAYIWYSEPTFVSCRFTRNQMEANGIGAAIYAGHSRVRLENCSIDRNTREFATGQGGTINYYSLLSDPLVLRNCTLTNNDGGPGLILTQGALGPTIERSILTFNTGVAWSTSALVTCSDVFGNLAGPYKPGKPGNFSADPQFCDAPAGTYTLRAGSPCLPGGNPCNILVGAHGVGCGAVFPVAVTVTTSPPGLPITVDGMPRTSPATFNWLQYSKHKVAVATLIQDAPGSRYQFVSWSDGGAAAHTLTVPGQPTTFTAQMKRQHRLEMIVEGAGSTNPATNWFDAGAVVSILATPSTGSIFNGWTGTGIGSYTGNANPVNLTISNPISETATFLPQGYHFSISSSDTDPAQNAAPPSNGMRNLYLWMTCSDPGLSAFETGVGGTLSPLAFNPLNGVLNIGSPSNLLLAVPNCPSSATGPFLLGSWLVWDTGGTLCLAPSSTGIIGAVDCNSFNPYLTLSPRFTGFSSSADVPCQGGANGCVNGGAARGLATGPVARDDIDADFQLSAPRPNPFTGSTELDLLVPGGTNVACAVYDVTGRVVRVLHDGLVESGRAHIAWEGTDDRGRLVAPGIYFVRAQTDERVVTRKVSLVSDGR